MPKSISDKVPYRSVTPYFGFESEPTRIQVECHNYPTIRGGGIMLDGRVPLHIFDAGYVTAQCYKDKVLETHVDYSKEQLVKILDLIDDNTRPNRANFVEDFIGESVVNEFSSERSKGHPMFDILAELFLFCLLQRQENGYNSSSANDKTRKNGVPKNHLKY
ncbi:hypothetical protein TNCV_47191 [Trichonephila clavipes]|nr:hypothetical protein TNCV_47191 [Trichonephila clavipes]